MAKFHGVIGYAIQVETVPGVWEDQIIERNYRGDVLQNMNRWQSSEQVNDNFAIDNKLSIISDPFAYENFQHIKYIRWMGANWKVTKVEILRPRLILTTGGVYNGPTA
jgi:predicted transposase YbfD/YdcC